ncbi:MAG: PCI domain-containing protein [Candidatus Heimdallarchaeaceae archaeon]
MPNHEEIAIINVGYKVSPFLEEVINREDFSFSIITNNSSDFQIHHADPSKVLNYHLEFTNVIAIKARKSIESLGIFETLGQYFEFYNPLHLSTLNFLISKFATEIKPEHKNYLKTWKEITKSIFSDETILPLFEEIRVLHVKEGDVEIPVRQYIMTKILDKQKDNKSKAKGVKPLEVTGIIDLEEISKMKLCSEAVKRITSAAGVIIVPSDVISLYILFQSEDFIETLQRTKGKITFISPLWQDNEMPHIEKQILEKTSFEPTLLNIAEMVKDAVDVIIIDKKDSDSVAKLREAGMTVLVEDLSPDSQKSYDFYTTIIKSLEVSLEDITIEPKKAEEGVGEKIVNMLKFGKKSEEETTEEKEQVTEVVEKKEENVGVEVRQKEKTEIQLTEESEKTLITEKEKDEPDIIETKAPTELETKPAKLQENKVNESIFSFDGESFALPGIDQISHLEWEDFESLDADEQIISTFIDRALQSDTTGVEVVFSELLSLQNNPLLTGKIYSLIIKRLIQLIERKPEERLSDMITYLAAHKPDYYINQLSIMLERILSIEDINQFFTNLKAASIVINSSLPISNDVFTKFLEYGLHLENDYESEKFRRTLIVLSATDVKLMDLLAKRLAKFIEEEIQKEKPDEGLLNKMYGILYLLDPCSVALACIESFSEKTISNFETRIKKLPLYSNYKTIITNIIKAFKAGETEKLIEQLHGRKLPDEVKFLINKRKYIQSVEKVGSIPLDIFAEQIGISKDEAEKMIYEMILKGEIQARIELVNGRSYIIKITEETEEKEQTEEEIIETEQTEEKTQQEEATVREKPTPTKKSTAKKTKTIKE